MLIRSYIHSSDALTFNFRCRRCAPLLGTAMEAKARSIRECGRSIERRIGSNTSVPESHLYLVV